jgi:arsenate reductase (thioredoxin)
MAENVRKNRVLFICTGNACRSQMAEALLRHLAGGRFEALSAGSDAAGFVHPIALEALTQLGIDAEGLRSKSWHEFADREVDAVITLCDNAASTPCPIWPGDPLRAHWPLPDPSFHPGTPGERLEFAVSVAEQLRRKILAMIALPFERGRTPELQASLAALANT